MNHCSLRSGPSPYSLKGSFGEPAAGSTSPSASTRPREFVFVFAVRSSCACVCLFDCLFLCVPLCFFGWLGVCGYMVFLLCLAPWGNFWCVFFAIWVGIFCVFCICGTLGLQCGTLGLHCSTLRSVLGLLGYMLQIFYIFFSLGVEL